jgi:hypothetical protein
MLLVLRMRPTLGPTLLWIRSSSIRCNAFVAFSIGLFDRQVSLFHIARLFFYHGFSWSRFMDYLVCDDARFVTIVY